jgi:hypothetical protein
MNKIKKVITLKPGEKFTLPPDSTLLSTTGVLSSTGCPVPIPEDYECFGINFSINDRNNGSDIPVTFQKRFIGINIGGVRYDFTEVFLDTQFINCNQIYTIGISSNSSLTNVIKDFTSILNPLINGDNGKGFIATFRALPSSMRDAFFYVRDGGTSDGGVFYYSYLPILPLNKLKEESKVTTLTCVSV